MTQNDATRRNVLAGLAAAGVALPVLSACGGSSSDTTGTTEPGGSGDGGQPGGSAQAGGEIATSEIPVGGGKIFPGRKLVVTQPSAGEFKAFSAVCTHQGCIVSKIADGTIDCGCHFSRYSIADGSVESGPAPSPLPAKTVTVTGSTLTVS